MEGIIWHCPVSWQPLLPPGIVAAEDARDLILRRWPLLALTGRGCETLERADCGILLVPGTRRRGLWPGTGGDRGDLRPVPAGQPDPVQSGGAGGVHPAGPAPAGRGTVEPQEFPLPRDLPAPAEELLPLLGLRLLQMPLTEPPFLW